MSYNESLSPNSNYPLMSQSEWDNAPFNEPIIPEQNFEVDVEYVLQKKNVKVTTDDYCPEFEYETGFVNANTEDTDWENAYSNSGHFTLQEMLNELKEYVKADMQTCSPNTCRAAHLKRLLEDCDGWELYDKSYSESE